VTGNNASQPPPAPAPAPTPAAQPAAQPIVDNRLFVLVLQHPQERHEPLATAAATVAALRHARLVSGLSWPNLARALGRSVDPKRWGVLYLGSLRPAALAAAPASGSAAGTHDGREILVLDRNDAPLADPGPVLRSLEGIVLLDGTWSQAKTLWWRNPWLLKLHRLVLNPSRPARIGRLRREPRREALSTIEAAALVLRHVEAGPHGADVLLAALDRLMEAARRPTG
jgi:DTW domain-containing protein